MYHTLARNDHTSDRNVTRTDPIPDPLRNHKVLLSPNEVKTSINAYIDLYCKSKLPLLTESQKYHTSYTVRRFICEHSNFVYNATIVSKKKLILYLCDNCLVPYKQTAIYHVAELYNQNGLFPHDTWTGFSTRGRKPYLSPYGFNELVSSIQEATAGGVAMPLSKVKE